MEDAPYKTLQYFQCLILNQSKNNNKFGLDSMFCNPVDCVTNDSRWNFTGELCTIVNQQ